MRERLCLPPHYDPFKGRKSSALRNLIDPVMENLDIDRFRMPPEIAEQWSEVVGGPIAKHTRPGRFQNGILTIYVDNPVWLAELKRFHKRKIFNELTRKVKPEMIRDIKFQPDPGDQNK